MEREVIYEIEIMVEKKALDEIVIVEKEVVDEIIIVEREAVDEIVIEDSQVKRKDKDKYNNI